MHVNEITEAIIGASIEVHRALGPGLLESAYVQCMRRSQFPVSDNSTLGCTVPAAIKANREP